MSTSNFTFPPPPPPPPPPTAILANAYLQGGNGPYGGGRGQGRGRGRGGGGLRTYRGSYGNRGYHNGPYGQNQHSYSNGNNYAATGMTNFSHGQQQIQFPNNSYTSPSNNDAFQRVGSFGHFGGANVHAGASITTSNTGTYTQQQSHVRNSHHSHYERPQRRWSHGQGAMGSRPPNTSQKPVPKSAVSPAVPSFASALFPTPIQPASTETENKKKRKRKHNVLGLTPRTEEHESSEEDADVDEEAKFASSLARGTGEGNLLQFSYNGQSSRLSTPAEIAAWIAERKKRYPTRAKQEEAAARRRAIAAQRAKREDEATLANLRRRAQESMKRTSPKVGNGELPGSQEAKKSIHLEQAKPKERPSKVSKESVHDIDSAAKVRRKAEKLQKRLEQARKELALIEAGCSTSNITSSKPAIISGDPLGEHSEEFNNDTTSAVPAKEGDNEFKGAHKESTARNEPNPSALKDVDELSDEDGEVASERSSSEFSSSDEETSSDESSSSDGEPLEKSSKMDITEDFPLPGPESRKETSICRSWATRGRCSYGKNCRFRHEPPRTPGSNNRRRLPDKAKSQERISLHQRLMARQQEEDEDRLLQYIKYLGDQGLLSDTDPQAEQQSQQSNVTE